MNKPKNMLKKDKLSIHIIYVKTNQSYFTYVSALSKGGFSMHTNPVIMIARC